MSDHCRRCGMQMELRTRPTGRFDPWRGAPTQREWRVCPNWKRRLIGGNGHDWRYDGENNIDGRDAHGKDPGFHENPPHPPAERVA